MRNAKLHVSNFFVQLRMYESLAAPLLLTALTFFAHGEALRGSWRWDDGAHLHFVEGFSPFQYFFVPKVAQAFSVANVSPWNALFYDINLSLFGMEVAGHYAHLLLVVAMGATLFYAVLRQWMAPLPAAFGAIAVLFGKPTYYIAAGLMHGHYATGFVFSMAAVLCWTLYLRNGQRVWWTISALTYLLATTCKEVYVPLVLLLPFLPVASWSQRIRALMPFFLVATLYTGWRYWLLGRLVGGYSEGAFDVNVAIHQFLRIPNLLFGSGLQVAAAISIPIALLLFASFQKRVNWTLVAVTFILISLPLLPLTAFPGINEPDRYLFVPWLAFSALLGAVSPRKLSKVSSFAVTTLLLSGLTSLHIHERRDLKANLAYWDTMYSFAISADKNRQAIFVDPEYGGSDDGYKRLVLTGARYAADMHAPQAQTGTLRIVDESGRGLFCVKATGMQLFEYIGGQMQPMPPERIAEKLLSPPHFEQPKDVQMQAEVVFESGVLHWKFGPYDGDYLVRYVPREIAPLRYTLPREGKTPWAKSHPLRFSLCRSGIAEEFDACSPVIEFNFESNEKGAWQGIARPCMAE